MSLLIFFLLNNSIRENLVKLFHCLESSIEIQGHGSLLGNFSRKSFETKRPDAGLISVIDEID
jgi:hypothetical protein